MSQVILLLSALLFISSCDNSESTLQSEEELKEIFTNDVQAYLKAYNEKDYAHFCSFIYPKLFNEHFSKANFVDGLERINKSGVDINFSFKEIQDISKVFVENKEQFCKFIYTVDATIIINDKMAEDYTTFEENYRNQYNATNIVFNYENNTFTLQGSINAVAIKENDDTKWKFTQYDPSNLQMLKKMFSNSIISTLKLQVSK